MAALAGTLPAAALADLTSAHSISDRTFVAFGTAAGLLFGGIALVTLVGTLPAAALADRAGRRWAILPSAAAESASLLLMAAAGALLFER